MTEAMRYWLKISNETWQEVTHEQYITAQCKSGLRPMPGDGTATAPFFSPMTKTLGRVTQSTIDRNKYRFDPAFLEVALQ